MNVFTYKNGFFLTILLFSIEFFGQNKDFQVSKLTNSSEVSLLTVGRSDEEIYQNFGHTAIRIKDSILGWDLVYNYGTFSYDDGFVWKFVKGKLLYYESIDNYPDFEQMYRDENRSINEQKLDLSQEQKQLLFERLTVNAREENKYYKYDFLFDNCSTRPRNILLSLFKTKNFKPDIDDNSSYRELIDRNVPNEWLDFGMDLLIGVPTDAKAKYGRTFLPIELMQLCNSAIVDGKKLVKSNELILDTIPENQPKKWFSPTILFWILFVVLLIIQVRTGCFSTNKITQIVFFTILGLFGWLFIFMWFFTEHLTTKWNLNILWAMPLNIPIIYFMLKKEIPKWAHGYVKFYRILLIVLVIGWYFNPQTYHNAVMPLVLISILFTSTLLRVPNSVDFKKRMFK
ncbi:MAG TPA: DUF4105 domain-containing protein [Chitinophagales bacterium]|nr:DUF4105 domain-containing protein [Chitinophagales bacterium]